MKSKFIIATSALAIITSVSAKADAFNGFYAGLQGGFHQFRTEAKVNGTVNGQPATLRGERSNNSLAGGFHFGYATVFSNNVYLAGVFDYDFRKKTKAVRHARMPGLDAKLGYKFNNNVVAYGKLGVTAQRFALTGNVANRSKTLTGLRMGAGFQVAVNDKISIGPEYTYTRFGKLSAASRINGVAASAKIRPAFHSVMARASYSF